MKKKNQFAEMSQSGFVSLTAVAAASALLMTFNSSAFADCVDYSEARKAQAAKALAKNPPKFAELGFPDLPVLNLVLDADKSSDDPKCDPSGGKRHIFFYKTSISRLEFYNAIFPYMKPWKTWTNPAGGNSHEFFLSSGSKVTIRCQHNCKEEDFEAPGKISEIMIDRRDMKDPLSTGGPGWNWTPEDLAKGRGQPAAGRADRERPAAAAAAAEKPPATDSGSTASGSSASGSESQSKAPDGTDTVNDALNKAKKLKDLLRF